MNMFPHEMPERPSFPVNDILSVSWRGFAQAALVLILSHFLFSLISGAIGTLLLGPLWYGLSLQALCAVRGEKVTFDQLFTGFTRFGPTFVWGIGLTVVAAAAFIVIATPTAILGYLLFDPNTQYLFSLAVSLGFGLAMLPTLALTVLYAPTMFFMYDREMELWEAMEASRRMVMSNSRAWMRLWGALALLHLLGILLCCIGLIVTTPWMAVALAEGYRREMAAVPVLPPQVPR